MNCLIQRNAEGNVVAVKTEAGAPSRLFNDIHSNIYLADAETSLKLMANAFSEKVAKADVERYEDTNEPKLYYRAPGGREFSSLEGLILSDLDGQVSMGFKAKDGEFIRFASFNTSGSDVATFLTDSVKEGVLSASRVLGEDGKTRFKGKGEFTETQKVTAQMAKFNALVDLGVLGKAHKDGTLEITFPSNYNVIETTSGNIEYVKTEDILSRIKEKDDVVNKVELLTKYFTSIDTTGKQGNTVEAKAKMESLERSLNSFLKNMGFSTLALEEYRSRYKTKYGKDPDIQAITDMANRIVAFKEGKLNIEDLSEEVAHIAIEFYTETESIAGALAVVHLTPEYNEYAAYYREKYSPFYEGIELEDQVRREILGKILAKNFQNNFNKEGLSGEQLTIFEKLMQIFNNFILKLQDTIKPHHVRTLDRLTNEIRKAVETADQSKFDSSKASTNFYYSAMSAEGKAIEGNLLVAAKATEELFKRVLKQPTPNQKQLDRVTTEMTEQAILSSANTIADMALTQLKVLEKNLDKLQKGEPINTIDVKRFDTLNRNIIPLLESIKVGLKDIRTADNGKFIDPIVETINLIKTKESDIAPTMGRDFNQTVEAELDRQLEGVPLTKEEREAIKSQMEGNIRDTTLISSKFGLMSQMQNPVIQMMARVISDMSQKVVSRFKSVTDPIINQIYDGNLQTHQRNIFKKKDGKKTFFFLSPIDYTAAELDIRAKQIELITSISGKDVKEVERLLEKFSPRQILKDEAEFKQYDSEISKFRREVVAEKRFSDEYYKQRDKRFKKAGVSQMTQEYLSSANAAVYDILRRSGALNPNGTIDRSKLSEAEKIEVASARRAKEVARSAYDQSGNLKDGLRKVKLSELSEEEKSKLPYYSEDFTAPAELLVTDEGVDIDSLSEDSRLALDLFNLSMVYRGELQKEQKNNKPSEQFLQEVLSLESSDPAAAFDWATSNATITLNDAYFNNLNSYQSYDVVAQQYIDSLPDTNNKDSKQYALNEYKDLQRAKKDLLRQNRKTGNPLETDVKNMPLPVRARLREIDARVEDLRKEISVPQDLYKNAGVSTSRRTVNDDFLRLATESNQSTYDFALSHMTENSRARVTNFAARVRDIVSGKATFTKPSHEKFVQEMYDTGVINKNMTVGERVEILKTEYAKRNVASYFQRYEPAGYEQLVDAFKSGQLKISDVLKDKQALVKDYPALEHIEIVPDYTWLSDLNEGEFKNDRYITDSPYYFKPNVEKYADKEFFDRYGIDMEAWKKNPTMDLTKMTPTKNQEEYQFLSIMVEMRKKTLENYDETNNISEFQAVQITASGFEKFARLSNLTNIAQKKDALRDFFQDRKDEKIYGEFLNDQDMSQLGSTVDVKLIPKYFQSRIEDADMLTESTLAAAFIDYKQSLAYQEKNNAERTLKALEWKVANQRFIHNGGFQRKRRILKEGAVSNYYAKAQEYLDYHLYGIQQSRHFEVNIFGQAVDLTKVGTKLQSFARFSNLGFNPFVDLTSATTGVLSNVLDRFAGDYYHKSSANRSNSLLTKLSGKFLNDWGKVNKTSELNQLIEFYGVVDPKDRLENSSFGRGQRLFSKSAYLLSQMANHPVGPRITLTVLCDFRLVDGRMVSYQEFLKSERINNPDTFSQVAMDAKWKSLEKNSMYDMLEITSSGIKYNDKFKQAFPENTDEIFSNINQKISAKVRQVVQNADGVLNETDQVAAQRDILTNPFLMHKGWLLINLTRKFKRNHFNVTTGSFEEGHYQTLLKAINDLKLNVLNPIAVKQWLLEQENYRRANARRVATEMIILSSLLLLGELVLGADDDDDTELENLAQLIYLRTTSEFASSTFYGVPGSVIESVKSPVAALSTYEKLNPVDLYRRAMKDGIEEAAKRAIKGTPLKRIGQLSDLQEQVNSFRHFNDATLFNLGEQKSE